MKVAVAIIKDEQNRILITQRPLHTSHGGYWEFPGGKLEENELAEQALVREIKEEIGIDVHHYEYLGEVQYQYPNKLVHLLVFQVISFSGIPECMEGQLNMKWIEKEYLNQENFPEANHGVFDLITV